MNIRYSKQFKQQVSELYAYLKYTFGKHTAIATRDEIIKQMTLLKSFPDMGTIELSLDDQEIVYRYLIVAHSKIIYSVESDYIFVRLLWDCRQNPNKMQDLVNKVD